MSKKDKKKDKKGSGAADAVEAVRSAVERALPEGSKDRGTQIVDEVARAVTRVRESLEQHGVIDELRGLRTEIEGLRGRGPPRGRAGKKPAASRSTAAKKPAASRSTAAKKPAASRSTAAKKPAASRS